MRLSSLHNVTKQFCRNNKNIIFTKADKGNITVALDREVYISKVEELLNDVNTYTVVKRNPIKFIENNLNNLLKKWLLNDYISKSQYFKLRSSVSNFPKAYGLPKVHKTNCPYRIIVSLSIQLCILCPLFCRILIPLVLKRTIGVLRIALIYITHFPESVYETPTLISLDVTSLFTNVPHDFALDSVSKRWPLIENNTKISKNEFIRAIKFVFSSTYFIFNNTIYKQTFGTPMGSSFSPVIADIVMRDLETSCLNSVNCHITFYYWYVDDIVMAVSFDNIDLIFKTFNNYHNRIKFTIEYGDSRSISFLDLLLTIKDDTLFIDWFHKSSFSGRFLSFYSGHPLCHKVGIRLGRAFLLSHPIFHEKNLRLIIELLIENGYPLDFIFKKINSRLKTLIYNNMKSSSTNNFENNLNSSKDNKKIIVIPYINKLSELIAATMDKSLYITGYRILNNLGKIVKTHKDTLDYYNNNNVVYKICCNDCSASYVGQTKRQLKTRTREHVNNSKSISTKPSVITEHIMEFSHSFD